MMTKRSKSFLLVLFLLIVRAESTSALPDYLYLFNQDPLKRAPVETCSLCHIDPGGGGGRNPFGEMFQENHEFTAMMRSSSA